MPDTAKAQTERSAEQISELVRRLANSGDPVAASYERAIFGADLCDFVERVIRESRAPDWDSSKAFTGYEERLFGLELCQTVLEALNRSAESAIPPKTTEPLTKTNTAQEKHSVLEEFATDPKVLRDGLRQEGDFLTRPSAAQKDADVAKAEASKIVPEVPVLHNSPFATDGRIGRLAFVIISVVLLVIRSFATAFIQIAADYPTNLNAFIGCVALLVFVYSLYLEFMNWRKRFRDRQKDPLNALWMFFPLVNVGFWFYLAFAPSRYQAPKRL